MSKYLNAFDRVTIKLRVIDNSKINIINTFNLKKKKKKKKNLPTDIPPFSLLFTLKKKKLFPTVDMNEITFYLLVTTVGGYVQCTPTIPIGKTNVGSEFH